MKIAYEASGLTHPRTGVGTYIQNLLNGLLNIDHSNKYWIFAHRDLRDDGLHSANGNSRWARSHFPNRLVWMQCVLPVALRSLRPDVVHYTNFIAPLVSHSRVVLTLHDVVLLESPQWCSPRQRLLMRPLLKPSVRRAHALITVSEQSKRDIVRHYALQPERVHVIHAAAPPHWAKLLDPAQRHDFVSTYSWDPESKNLLCVGTLEPRKNLDRLVSALASLHARGQRAHLWLVGQHGWHSSPLVERVAALGLDSYVHCPGFVPGDHLRAFYQLCDVFVMPSLYEGFGLPVLEAMMGGAVVALSDLPVLREVAGDAAHYFSPTDENDMAECLMLLLTSPDREEFRRAARARALQFSWERAARQTLAVYQTAANGHAGV